MQLNIATVELALNCINTRLWIGAMETALVCFLSRFVIDSDSLVIALLHVLACIRKMRQKSTQLLIYLSLIYCINASFHTICTFQFDSMLFTHRLHVAFNAMLMNGRSHEMHHLSCTPISIAKIISIDIGAIETDE